MRNRSREMGTFSASMLACAQRYSMRCPDKAVAAQVIDCMKAHWHDAGVARTGEMYIRDAKDAMMWCWDYTSEVGDMLKDMWEPMLTWMCDNMADDAEVAPVEDADFELAENEGCILLYALRYALGRHSYITSAVSGYIRDHWDDPGTVAVRRQCLDEIIKHLDSTEVKDNSTLWDETDVWAPLKKWMLRNLDPVQES